MFKRNTGAQHRPTLQTMVLVSALLAVMSTAHADALPASVLGASLGGIDQKSHQLKDWNGKLRIVNFWATWCVPCRGEIPVLQAAADAWREDAVVIGVALDNAKDVRRFSQQAGIRYPLLLAQEQGPGLMKLGGNATGALPFTLLVDGRGNILQRHSGPITANQLDRWLHDATGHPLSSN